MFSVQLLVRLPHCMPSELGKPIQNGTELALPLHSYRTLVLAYEGETRLEGTY